jgi:hypothetical protein
MTLGSFSHLHGTKLHDGNATKGFQTPRVSSFSSDDIPLRKFLSSTVFQVDPSIPGISSIAETSDIPISQSVASESPNRPKLSPFAEIVSLLVITTTHYLV